MSRVPFQILELTLISAQDLQPPCSKNISKNLKTYAVAWMTPDRKLRTTTAQKGGNNPHWNQKFLFRVEDKQMESASASLMIEIYAAGWLKDSIIGSVTVLIRDLIPPSVRKEHRVVALQIRRNSGRPQGILSMGVTLLDNTMRSMPLCTVLTGSTVGFQDICGGEKKGNENQAIRLNRTMSDQTNLLRRLTEGKRKKNSSISICNDSALTGVVDGGGLVVNPVFEGCGGGGGGSMLNGSLISDLGPSPSVVAIAISHGLYPLHQGPPPNPGSSVVGDWTVEEDVKMKMEQWLLDRNQGYQRLGNGKKRQKKRNRRRSRTGGDGDGRFSCFGKVCGCEFTLVCGSGNGGKKGERNNRRPASATTTSKISDSELSIN